MPKIVNLTKIVTQNCHVFDVTPLLWSQALASALQYTITMNTKNEYFYYEVGKYGPEIKIPLDALKDIAEEAGDDRNLEEMDDNTFYNYCEAYVESL